MAGRADIRAGSAYVRLYSRNAELFSGLKSASERLNAFGQRMSVIGAVVFGVGTAITSSLIGAVTRFSSLGDAASKAAQRTGLTTNAVSELGYAAGQSGSNVDELEGAIRKMQKTVAEAREGSKEARSTLRGLGITFDMLKETPDAQLELFADRLSQIKDPATRAKAAMDVFGKSGTNLLPLFAGGAKGIRDLREEAWQLGQSIDPADAAAATALGDAWDRVKKATGGAVFSIGGVLAPALNRVLDVTQKIVVTASQWIRNNREMVEWASKLALGTVAVGAATYGLGQAINKAGSLVSGLSSVLRPVVDVTGQIQKHVTALLGGVGKLSKSAIEGIGKTATSFGSAARSAGQFSIAVSTAAVNALTNFASTAVTAGRFLSTGLVSASVVGFNIVRQSLSTVSAGIARLPSVASTAASAMGAALNRIGEYAVAIYPRFARLGVIAREAADIASFGWMAAGRAIRSAVDNVVAQGQSSWDALRAKTSATVDAMKVRFTQWFDSLYPQWQRLAGAASMAFDRIRSITSPVTSAVRAAWTTASQAVAGAFSRVMPLITEDFNRVVNVSRAAAERVVATWRSAVSRISTAVSSGIGGAFARAGAASSGAAGMLGRGVGGLGRGAGGVAVASIGLVSSFGDAATKALGSMAMVVPQVLMLGSALVGMVNPATLVVGAILGGVYAWTRFSESGQRALDRVMNVLRPFIETARTAISGIADAFTAGDLALAGRIAVTGLQLVFAQGMESLSGMVGGVLGETLGKISGQIAGGDFAGAWETAVKGMAAVWDAWSEGVVKTFTAAARVIMDFWKGTMSWISNTILEVAAQGGVTGKLLSKALGVDVSEEQAKAEQKRLERISALERSIAGQEQQSREARDKGDLVTAEKHSKAAQNFRNSLASLKGAPVNILGDMSEDVDRQLGMSVSSVNSVLDSLDKSATDKANASGQALADGVGGGTTQASENIQRLEAELATLREEAARKREALVSGKAAEGQESVDGAREFGKQGGDVSKQLGSFSAAALMSGGFSGPQERLTKIAEDQKKIASDTKAAIEKQSLEIAKQTAVLATFTTMFRHG